MDRIAMLQEKIESIRTEIAIALYSLSEEGETEEVRRLRELDNTLDVQSERLGHLKAFLRGA